LIKEYVMSKVALLWWFTRFNKVVKTPAKTPKPPIWVLACPSKMKINDRELVFVASADGPPVDKEGILMKRCVCEKFLMRTTLFASVVQEN
jgi:hypothetical protein